MRWYFGILAVAGLLLLAPLADAAPRVRAVRQRAVVVRQGVRVVRSPVLVNRFGFNRFAGNRFAFRREVVVPVFAHRAFVASPFAFGFHNRFTFGHHVPAFGFGGYGPGYGGGFGGDGGATQQLRDQVENLRSQVLQLSVQSQVEAQVQEQLRRLLPSVPTK